MSKQKRSAAQKGFTLMEVLLVVAILVILAGIVIVAVNPARQIGKSNNAKRWAHVNTILNAVHQYAVDHQGMLPDTIPEAANCEAEEFYEICKTDASDCTNLVDLSVLTTEGVYLVRIPENPGFSDGNGAGYNIVKGIGDRVTVCAVDTYDDEIISVTR